MRHSWITLVVGAVLSAAPATLAAHATTAVERNFQSVEHIDEKCIGR